MKNVKEDLVPRLVLNAAIEVISTKDEEIFSLVEMLEACEYWLSAPPTSQSDRDCVNTTVRSSRALLKKYKDKFCFQGVSKPENTQEFNNKNNQLKPPPL